MVYAEGDCAARSHRDDSYDETFLHCLSTAAKIGEMIQSAKSFAFFLHFAPYFLHQDTENHGFAERPNPYHPQNPWFKDNTQLSRFKRSVGSKSS